MIGVEDAIGLSGVPPAPPQRWRARQRPPGRCQDLQGAPSGRGGNRRVRRSVQCVLKREARLIGRVGEAGLPNSKLRPQCM